LFLVSLAMDELEAVLHPDIIELILDYMPCYIHYWEIDRKCEECNPLPGPCCLCEKPANFSIFSDLVCKSCLDLSTDIIFEEGRQSRSTTKQGFLYCKKCGDEVDRYTTHCNGGSSNPNAITHCCDCSECVFLDTY
jgi:hypothetical protein